MKHFHVQHEAPTAVLLKIIEWPSLCTAGGLVCFAFTQTSPINPADTRPLSLTADFLITRIWSDVKPRWVNGWRLG